MKVAFTVHATGELSISWKRSAAREGHRSAGTWLAGQPLPENDPARVAQRKGEAKGGQKRASTLTSEQRSEIAKKVAAKRWNKPTRSRHAVPVESTSQKARLGCRRSRFPQPVRRTVVLSFCGMARVGVQSSPSVARPRSTTPPRSNGSRICWPPTPHPSSAPLFDK